MGALDQFISIENDTLCLDAYFLEVIKEKNATTVLDKQHRTQGILYLHLPHNEVLRDENYRLFSFHHSVETVMETQLLTG